MILFEIEKFDVKGRLRGSKIFIDDDLTKVEREKQKNIGVWGKRVR